MQFAEGKTALVPPMLLTEALEKLPERLRMVLSLHYIEDLTYREIAGMLAVSEPRVCQLHSAALAQLRKLLAEK